MKAPYYQDDYVTLYHGDARDMKDIGSDVVVTDPPYGIAYKSGHHGALPREIQGDADHGLRDEIVAGHDRALVFGSWRVPPPPGTRMALVWDKGPALGMGALDLPWKPSFDMIFVKGKGFKGYRSGAVLMFPPVQSMAKNGRTHPHEKPVLLLKELIGKCLPGVVLDPFAGTGSTLVAAKSLNRKAIGIEAEERYCEVAATRLSQEVLGLSVAS